MQLQNPDDDVTVDMEEMDTETKQGEEKGTEEEFTLRKFLSSQELYRPLFIACMLQVIQQFSGINAVSRIPNPPHSSFPKKKSHVKTYKFARRVLYCKKIHTISSWMSFHRKIWYWQQKNESTMIIWRDYFQFKLPVVLFPWKWAFISTHFNEKAWR